MAVDGYTRAMECQVDESSSSSLNQGLLREYHERCPHLSPLRLQGMLKGPQTLPLRELSSECSTHITGQ